MLDDGISIEEICKQIKDKVFYQPTNLNMIESNGKKFLIVYPGVNDTENEGGISSYYDSPAEDDLFVRFKAR
jgi:hypothetical protein